MVMGQEEEMAVMEEMARKMREEKITTHIRGILG